MTATSGLSLAGYAISTLLELNTIQAGNFPPSLVLCPLIVYLQVLTRFCSPLR
jgi:hypothetical protein